MWATKGHSDPFYGYNTVKSRFNESRFSVKSRFKEWNLVTKMKFVIKKSRFSVKSRVSKVWPRLFVKSRLYCTDGWTKRDSVLLHKFAIEEINSPELAISHATNWNLLQRLLCIYTVHNIPFNPSPLPPLVHSSTISRPLVRHTHTRTHSAKPHMCPNNWIFRCPQTEFLDTRIHWVASCLLYTVLPA